MAIKKCLGLNTCLSSEKMYSWLFELTPKERAELCPQNLKETHFSRIYHREHNILYQQDFYL